MKIHDSEELRSEMKPGRNAWMLEVFSYYGEELDEMEAYRFIKFLDLTDKEEFGYILNDINEEHKGHAEEDHISGVKISINAERSVVETNWIRSEWPTRFSHRVVWRKLRYSKLNV